MAGVFKTFTIQNKSQTITTLDTVVLSRLVKLFETEKRQ